MDLSLSEAEMQLIERLLKAERASAAGSAEERNLVIDELLQRLSHPMRGGGRQDESALLTDVGASIAPDISTEERRRVEGRHSP